MQREAEPPKDSYNGVYLILLLHGIGTLLPWNMFITAGSYYVNYKLTVNDTETSYVTYFLSYVGISSQIPNIIANWINVFISMRGSVTPRIVVCLCIEILIFITTILLLEIDSSKWVKTFFWITMIKMVILNVANGIYQNTIFGLAAAFPPKYPVVLLTGANVSGVIVSFTNLLSIIIAPSLSLAVIAYFSVALVILLLCLLTYYMLPHIRFYSYYKWDWYSDVNDVSPPYWEIMKKIFVQLFNIFLVFFVSLSIFPAVQANIKQYDSDFLVPIEYYEVVMCYVTFNTSAMLGCILNLWIKWPRPDWLVALVVFRVFFIPFFFFCNYHPTYKHRTVKVFITNDWVYWMVGILFGVSSGFCSSKAMEYATSAYPEYSAIAGKYVGAVIVTGIFVGVTFSMIFPWLAGL